jgi:hypothetical protein
MKDPLELLKNFRINSKIIKQKESYLYFDSEKLDIKTETAWLSKKTLKRYDLGSLWLFLEHKSKATAFTAYLS